MGIDGIDLQFETEISFIDDNLISTVGDNYFELEINSSYYKNGQIKEIRMESVNFGKIIIHFNFPDNNTKCTCFMRLIDGGMNVKTIKMSHIMFKLKNVLTCISLFSNVNISYPSEEEILIQGIEIAYTFATLEKMLYQTRLLILKTFSNIRQPNKKRYEEINDDPFDHHIIATKVGYNFAVVLYDKTAKAQSDNYIENIKDHGYRIYRLEFVIKKGKILELLGSRLLSKVTDESIKNFFDKQIENAIKNLIIEIEESVKQTDQALGYYYKKFGSREYMPRFFSGILTPALEKSHSIVLDEEIFCHIKLPFVDSIKNKSRIRRKLLTECIIQSTDNMYILSEMITWQSLIFLKIMKSYIYGDIDSEKLIENDNKITSESRESKAKVKVIYISHFESETRIAIYDRVLSSRTKSTTIEKIILERLETIDIAKFQKYID
ncbi:TPA: hypothetical protein U1C81_002257 [Streptococcus suis]|nr:hypothetical protein [Streptococcus suis]HEM3722594.1 hypothetical protein [Streptococcus suis]